MYSKQKTFNIVVNHLRKQGRKAMAEMPDYGGCMYRTPNGDKCAVGCLISNTDYSRTLEGKVSDFIYDLVPSLQMHDCGLLCSLQHAHDEPTMSIEEGLQSVAEAFGLELPPIETTINCAVETAQSASLATAT
jgi:hypothetical protein